MFLYIVIFALVSSLRIFFLLHRIIGSLEWQIARLRPLSAIIIQSIVRDNILIIIICLHTSLCIGYYIYSQLKIYSDEDEIITFLIFI